MKNEIKDEVIESLDSCLASAKKNHNAPCLILKGLPGSGKTARVNAWLKANNLKHFYINASCLKIAKFNKTDNILFSSDEIDKLKNEELVIFIDEYDRATPQVRKELCTLATDLKVFDTRINAYKHINYLMMIIVVDSINLSKIKLTNQEKSIFEN